MSSYPDLIFKEVPEDTDVIVSWDQLMETYRKHFNLTGRWVFRGHEKSSYNLKSSLERAVLSLALGERNPTRDVEGSVLAGMFGKNRTVLDLEGGLIRRFRRECHRYVTTPPSRPLELLALMQHYSAPTRLQDWTYSFYVALFFAIEAASPQKSERCSVWALDAQWTRERFKVRHQDLYLLLDVDRNLQKQPDSFRSIFRQERRFVCPMNPYFLNDRLIIQQGVFLCPGAVCYRFEDNIAELQYDENHGTYTEVQDAPAHLMRIDIGTAPDTRKDILQNLLRMNISRTTLFPGLDGFARSLESVLVFPDTLEYGDMYETDFPI